MNQPRKLLTPKTKPSHWWSTQYFKSASPWQGSSVNDGIPLEHSRVCYATIGDAINHIKTVGTDAYLAKTDIKSAFRILTINPIDYGLLGMKWEDKYYYDHCMPMGCSSSCKTFETFISTLKWIARTKFKIQHVLHLLDDFLFIAPSECLCQQKLNIFLEFCSYLGVPIALEKTCGPATTLSFVGIELDTVLMEAKLPRDKLDKCVTTILEFQHRKKVALRELQSLIGLLNFACSVVQPGRAFLRRLIDFTIGIKSPSHKIRPNQEVKIDLNLWLNFLEDFNGKSFFLDDNWLSYSKLNLNTDASGAHGFGAVFGSHWCYGKWPSDWAYRNTAILEFYPIVVSLYLWGHAMCNKHMLFFTNNNALVYVINRQSCKERDLMFFVRKLVLACLRHNIVFKAKHTTGVSNILADTLSRLQVQAFKQIAPQMDSSPTPVPLCLQPQNFNLQS
ncbi:uncharacterized protein LOC111327038 [Stylophora pistillata]|uniref:Reverse transcriptase domain-containing protein n=1 Tax=Stylophora pistillata TaxID=50429 RepID=A0A2B4SHG0_STYPI|nr:uncharacterized protein LOC111327038 [Stylophora pistillata]PFX27885.1 hypothetical protein AWC38_SpisGene7435 [Stylophora pistillata]